MTGSDDNPLDANSPRPHVAMPRTNRGPLIFGFVLAATASSLFSALEARRANLSSPAITVPRDAVGARLASPPPLAIPQGFAADLDFDPGNARTSQEGIPDDEIALLRRSGPVATSLPTSYGMARAEAPYAYPDLPQPQSMPPTPAVLMRPQSSAPVYEQTPQPDPDRAVATRFANPASTIPKGTVIHAVLETAFDSTRAGFARAIISRDVRSFDGGRVLVPKGSKLLGEYQADLNHGQNRALIQWHRLMLPGGVMIDVDSPSVDALGRAGVKGKVNSHFFARFGGSILQSVLDIGVQVATRKAAGDTLIVGVPIGTQERIAPQGEVKPTLKIRQGSSVAVLVARDLDFTSVMP